MPVAHWVDVPADQIDQLAILTDSLQKFDADADEETQMLTVFDGDRAIPAPFACTVPQSIVDAARDVCAGRADSLADVMCEPKRTAANDNVPDELYDFLDLYGGSIGMGRLYNATVDRVKGNIYKHGSAFFFEWGPPSLRQVRKIELPPKRRDPLNFITASRFAHRPIPVREWFLEGLIPNRTVTILNGDGGVGKSLLALQIAAAAAMGCETLGLTPTADRALYIGAEDEAEEFHRRLADISASMDRDLASLHSLQVLSLADSDAILATPDKNGTMHPTDLWLEIAEHVEKFKPRFVVFDTAADLFGGDEIKRPHVRGFIALLRKMAIEGDCAVLLLAHPSVEGMKSGSGSSGSTAWNNSVRSRLYLTRPTGDSIDPDARVLKTMKANYGTTGDEIRLRWKAGAFVLDDGTPSPAAALLAKRADDIFIQLLDGINASGQRVSSSKSVTYAPSVMADMPGAAGVKKKELEAAMKRLLASGKLRVEMEGPASKQRQRLVAVHSN
ncbi:AAA family ATPase [Rhizobium cremeum]|uniref:AAA family ATPase n=1 Tax=Rhizobium cremeum TaxID=2813827 RepID=UPI001FD2B3F5|nr:AAA family ATPase [Rhizobium cremeum]MCJ7995889.1 AAA family ATPase [Rhizobium cremeum]MCJ7999644.1 AAA family ATPase [Rhizobium cremeum]